LLQGIYFWLLLPDPFQGMLARRNSFKFVFGFYVFCCFLVHSA